MGALTWIIIIGAIIGLVWYSGGLNQYGFAPPSKNQGGNITNNTLQNIFNNTGYRQVNLGKIMVNNTVVSCQENPDCNWYSNKCYNTNRCVCYQGDCWEYVKY